MNPGAKGRRPTSGQPTEATGGGNFIALVDHKGIKAPEWGTVGV